MELKEVLGIRPSIRYFDPDQPVEREKIQKILEAMRIASCAVNAHWLRAVVVNRAEIPADRRVRERRHLGRGPARAVGRRPARRRVCRASRRAGS